MNLSHLYTGFFKAKIIGVNPDREELEKITGEREEVKYIWSRSGINYNQLTIYLESPGGRIFEYKIHLSDREEISKTGKICYINCIGDIQFVENESQLFDSMLFFEDIKDWINPLGEITRNWKKGSRPHTKEVIGNKQPRIALEGERDLLHLRRVLTKINPYNADSYLFYDMEKIVKGDVEQILKDVDSSEFHLTAFAYVDSSYIQRIWKRFLPVSVMRDINNNMNISQYSKKVYDIWKDEALGDFGMDGFYNLDKLQPFTEEFIKGKRSIKSEDNSY